MLEGTDEGQAQTLLLSGYVSDGEKAALVTEADMGKE